MKRFLLFLTIILTLNNPFDLYSQTGSAKIKGKVTDSITGVTLPGATVVLDGTSLGAATNLEGEYIISNIKPGTYTIKVTYIGYKNIVISNVQLSAGQTFELNGNMSPEGILTEGVVVTAQAKGQRSAINQMRTSNAIINVVSSDKIRICPM